MSKPTVQVTIVDAAGVRQTFHAGRVELDCGCGCIDILHGRPAFCRGFDRGVLTLDDGNSVVTLDVYHGMASLTGDEVHVICEQTSATSPAAPLSPPAIPCPAQPPAATTNKHQQTS